MEEISTFIISAICIPVIFLFLGPIFRFIIKRELSWELTYLGMDISLAGIGTALAHLFSLHPEPPLPLVPNGKFADILHVPSFLSCLSLGAKAGVGITGLFVSLGIITFAHAYFGSKPKPLSKNARRAEVFCLGLCANTLSIGALVYMERLLR